MIQSLIIEFSHAARVGLLAGVPSRLSPQSSPVQYSNPPKGGYWITGRWTGRWAGPVHPEIGDFWTVGLIGRTPSGRARQVRGGDEVIHAVEDHLPIR